MNGLRLACLYSFKCERATKLGINDQLLDYVQNYKNYSRSLVKKVLITSLLKQLISYQGYQGIAGLLGKGDDCFEKRIIRAYWLGDKKLEHFNHNSAVLESFNTINADEHMPVLMAEEKLDCGISFGEVIEISSEKAKVSNQRLLYKKGRVFWGEETREIDTMFVPNLKKGDLVSVHRAIAREKISKNRAKTLENITRKALQTLQIA